MHLRNLPCFLFKQLQNPFLFLLLLTRLKYLNTQHNILQKFQIVVLNHGSYLLSQMSEIIHPGLKRVQSLYKENYFLQMLPVLSISFFCFKPHLLGLMCNNLPLIQNIIKHTSQNNIVTLKYGLIKFTVRPISNISKQY